MGNRHAFSRAFSWSSLLVLALMAHAGADTSSLSGPDFNSTLPPQFDAAKTAGLANMFSSCMNLNSGIEQLGNVFTGQGGVSTGGFGMNASCSGPDSLSDPGGCEAFSDASGQFDPAMLSAFKEKAQSVMNTLACKKGKIDAIRTELGCLRDSASMVAQQIASLQTMYTANIQRMQQDVQKLDTLAADRQGQIDDVTQRLGGDSAGGDNKGPATGKKGLLATREAMRGVLNAMPQDIQGIKELQINADNARKALQVQIDQRTIALTSECFNTRPNPAFRCAPNGKDSKQVSARDYILCRYRQNHRLGANGQIESNQNIDNATEGDTAVLDGILSQISGDAPSQTKLPQTQQDAQATIDQPFTIKTVADVEDQFGDQLRGVPPVPGINVHDFVIKNMGTCFNRANRIVANERDPKNTTSSIGIAQAKITAMERDTSKQVNQNLDKYAQAYQDMMNELTGVQMPLNVSACRNAAPQTQANCMDEIRSKMDGMVNGNDKTSAIKIMVAGKDPANNIVFNCNGLDGCITAMQNISRNLVTEKKRIDDFKQSYVLRANQSVDAFTKQLAGMMSPQSQALQRRLQELNSSLGSLGVSGIDIQPVDCEDPSKDDKTGLPNPPKNIMGYVGCQMNPKMLNIQGNNFSGALSGIGTAMNDLNTKQGSANDVMNKLARIPTSCANKTMNASVDKLNTAVNQLVSSECFADPQWCQTNGDKLQSLGATISELNSGTNLVGLDDINSTLSTGIGGCVSAAANGRNPSSTSSTTPASNPQLDLQIKQAQGKVDDAKRDADLKKGPCDAAKADLAKAQTAVSALPANAKPTDISRAQLQLQTAQTAQQSACSDYNTAMSNVTTAQNTVDQLNLQKVGSPTTTTVTATNGFKKASCDSASNAVSKQAAMLKRQKETMSGNSSTEAR